MELLQCMNCGRGGWTIHELKQGLCPSCQEEENYFNEDDFECCDECTQPDACADYGCAIKQGLIEPNTCC